MFIPYIKKAWNPSRLIDGGAMSLWIDASDTDTITDAAGVVSGWKDKSGNGNDLSQSTEASKPATNTNTLNNKNVIKFDGDFFNLSTLSGIKSVICVTNNLNGSPPGANISSMWSDAAVSNYTFIRVNTTDGDYEISIDGISGNTGNASVNGGALVSGTNINLSLTDAEAKADNVWYADYDNAIAVDKIAEATVGQSLKGDIAEMCFFTEVISESTRQKLEGYLAHKWGIASKLASGHPYEKYAPTL